VADAKRTRGAIGALVFTAHQSDNSISVVLING